jgi:glycosyltransferase involved in cell wall biosynthesis
VTCGYNSTKEQQHFEIIRSIENLEHSYKDRCEFVFPLTYGSKTQKELIKKRLQNVDFEYKVLENFLYGDDNAYIKLVSDVMINMLKTDSFSGSMQEFLYAKNVVITGTWLPYDLFDEMGIKYFKIDKTDELKNMLENVIENLKNMRENLDENRKIIYNLSSWENNINSWIAVYEN